jgi:F0F1-type ATP synthase assembly protein I
MTQPDDISKQSSPQKNAFNIRLVSLGAQVGCLTLVVVFLGLFGGMWLDRMLGTKPLFTIALVLGAAPLALFLSFWAALQAVKDLNLPPAKGTKPSSQKEDETGE